jgi:hypothetical protein
MARQHFGGRTAVSAFLLIFLGSCAAETAKVQQEDIKNPIQVAE